MRTVNAEYVGQDPTSPNGSAATSPGANVDLRPVTFGAQTFSNPFFWLFLGIAGTIAVQWLLKNSKR